MKLIGSTTSPFVRKVRVSLLEKGLELPLEALRPTPLTEHPELRALNPISKVPCLVLADGTPLYDSRVILEYLDDLVPEAPLFLTGDARWADLCLQALADGILEAGVAVFYEFSFRPKEYHWQPWLDAQCAKSYAGLKQLEQVAGDWDEELSVGKLAVVCVLDWLHFRKALDLHSEGPVELSEHFPKLWNWHQRMSLRPSLQQTHPAL